MKYFRICLIFIFLFLSSAIPVSAAYVCSVTEKVTASLPKEYFGLFTDTYSLPQDQPTRLQFFKQIKAAGFYTVRLQLNWSMIERPKDQYSWTYFDPIFKDIESAGLEALPVLIRIPVWALPTTGDLAGKNVLLPEYYPNWNKFVSEAVKRYSKNIGSVAKVTQNWEVWNEPELTYEGAPSSMLNILNTAYDTIKATDPQAKVWAPPLSTTGLRALFFNTGRTSTDIFKLIVKSGKFDALSVHIYEDIATSLELVSKTKAYLAANGNATNKNAKFVITETNDSLEPCDRYNERSLDKNAKQITDRYACLTQAGVSNVFYFAAMDLPSASCSNAKKSIDNGLFNSNFTPRPGYYFVKEMIATLARSVSSPTPTPTSSPSPTPTSSPTNYRWGDLNGDNKINNADSVLLKAKFGNPYTYLDYVGIITNWGK